MKNLKCEYQNTSYEFKIDGNSVAIRIDDTQSTLNSFLMKRNWVSYAIISAANPQSDLRSSEENKIRHQQLISSLKDHYFIDGWNRASNPTWDEQSLLIFDITRLEAEYLAECFEQAAIVFGSLDEKAELIWLRR